LTGENFNVAKYQKVDTALNLMIDEYGADLMNLMKSKSIAAAQEVTWIQQVHTIQSIAMEKKL
jgi:hypothetical protein